MEKKQFKPEHRKERRKMKLLTSELDEKVTFKLTANMLYPEYEWTVTWVILEASKEDIKNIDSKTHLISPHWYVLKKAKSIGSDMYVIPIAHAEDCISSIHDILERDLCPTITPAKLRYLYSKCDDSHKCKLTNLDEISF